MHQPLALGWPPADRRGTAISLYAIYLGFALVAAPLFRLLRTPVAVLAVYIGGWLLLPVGAYPLIPRGSFPWWIPGVVLPSNLLVTKAWVPAVVAIAGAALADPASVRRWRPSLVDLSMLGWCLWPLVGLFVDGPRPAPLVASLYLVGSWGAPWLLGRIWFQRRGEQLLLLRALAWAAIACLPFAVLEGLRPAFLYESLYGFQPFATDGIIRYIGYRPLGLFEHGNQYGIWVALGALAAVWLAVADEWRSPARWGLAAAAVLIALASQSLGALLLLALGITALALWRTRVVRAALVALALLVGVAGVVHVSGVLPLQTIARNTAFGQAVLGEFRRVGRGSFTWRVSQDTKTLEAVKAAPIVGTQQWDWWRPFGTRPWGLALLILGQFGLVGLILSGGTLFYAGVAALARSRFERPWSPAAVALPLGLIVLLALGDGLLNAFFYCPAMLVAGAIAERSVATRHADARLTAVR